MPYIVKNTTLIGLLDLLVPHSCRGCSRTGSALCERCKNNIISSHQNICPICKNPNPTGNCPKCPKMPPAFIADTRSSLTGTLIHDYKYHSVRALASPLAEILNSTLPPTIDQATIVPLPTVSKHIRARGFDHTHLLAKRLAKLRKNSFTVEKLLVRDQNTVQVGTDRKSRLSQAEKAYTISPKARMNPTKTYILLDDVWTTGASMHAATKKLRQAGAEKIIILLLALSGV